MDFTGVGKGLGDLGEGPVDLSGVKAGQKGRKGGRGKGDGKGGPGTGPGAPGNFSPQGSREMAQQNVTNNYNTTIHTNGQELQSQTRTARIVERAMDPRDPYRVLVSVSSTFRTTRMSSRRMLKNETMGQAN